MPSSADRTFKDRREAGRILAKRLTDYRARSDVVVLGLARGGVPVASQVATALGAPMHVFVVRKLGVPQWPELAMGAIASGGGVIINEAVVRNLHVTDAQLQAVIDAETKELARREAVYRSTLVRSQLDAKTVILVDDGIATGASMLAAIQAVRKANAKWVVVAVPVGPRSVYDQLRAEADDVVFAVIPTRFEAVGQVFADFHQVSDREVQEAMNLEEP